MAALELGTVVAANVDGEARLLQFRAEDSFPGLCWFRVLSPSHDGEEPTDAAARPALFNVLIVDGKEVLRHAGMTAVGVFPVPEAESGVPPTRSRKARWHRSSKSWVEVGWQIRPSTGDPYLLDHLDDEHRRLDLSGVLNWSQVPALLRSGWTPDHCPDWYKSEAIAECEEPQAPATPDGPRWDAEVVFASRARAEAFATRAPQVAAAVEVLGVEGRAGSDETLVALAASGDDVLQAKQAISALAEELDGTIESSGTSLA